MEWCYSNSHKIPIRYSNLFRLDIDTLYEERSVYYLKQWIGAFQAHSDQTLRELGGGDSIGGSGSCGTFDTEDVETEEYWLDTNDGMDIEEQMAEAGISAKGVKNVSTDGDVLNIEPKPPW